MEHIARKKRLLGDPALNIDEGAQEDTTENERGRNVGRGPALWCVAAIRKSEDDQYKTWDHSHKAPPIHLDVLAMLVFGPIRDAEICYDADEGKDDGADEEKPSPCRELCGNTSEEDTREEADGGEGTVETEHQILSRTRAVLWQVSMYTSLVAGVEVKAYDATQEHDSRRKKCSRPETLERSTEDEHGVVLAKPCDDCPNEEPYEPANEDNVSAVQVS